MNFMRSVAEKYPEYAEVESIGRSYENREMLYIRIGYPTGRAKKTMLVDAGIHARQWISSATALYFIEKLVVDTKYINLLEAIDIVVISNMNPDGYEYSRRHDRLWKKTRSKSSKRCYGVDLNRNFPFKWGYSGSSDNACSSVYHGPEALSEVESRNLAQFLDANNDSIKAYVSLHSYGQNIIYPWGYESNTCPSDIDDLRELGLAAAKVIQSKFGSTYIVGSSADDLYPASGSSDDYAKSLGIKYAYTIELQPGSQPMDNAGYYGFQLPQKFILSAAEEASVALLVIAEKIAGIESSENR
uniref:Peptidase_M14 domain-containing protein n=1 Tax=Syphacia muris TaxID=451379 RepID=A0A0N5A8I9_9BILA